MKKKVLAMSLLTIIMCLSLIIGATLALFTSKSNVDIAVTSGNVEVVATVDASEAQSKQLNEEYAKGLDHTFAKGVSINGGTVTLKDFVPGDGVKFDIKIQNESSVPVKYRTIVTNNGSEELFNALDVTFDGEQPQWDELAVGSADKTVNVTVEFPDEADGVQNQTTTLTFTVEAVQGNAEVPTVVTNADGLVAALQDDTVKEIELTRGVFDLSAVNTMHGNDYGLYIDRPVTIFGAGDATVLKFGNNGNAISGQADLMISSSNVGLRDFAIVGGHTDNGTVSTIKVTNLTEGGEDPSQITLQNLTVTAGAGHAINIHGATNVTIDGCTLSDYGKVGVAMARANGVTVQNTTFTNAAAWGDIGLMFDTENPDNPAFATPSRLILGEGNVLAKNLIYSERPASAESGKDTVEGADAYGLLVESESGWTIVAPVAKIGDVGYATVQSAIDAAANNDIIEIYADTVAEQIVVDGKNVTIRAAKGRQPVIVGPADYTKMTSVSKTNINESKDVYSIVLATNGATLTLENVTVEGKLDFTQEEIEWLAQTETMRYSGVASCNASLTMNGVDVYDIVNQNYFGFQNVCSVYAVGEGNVEIDGCRIERFQKGGIVARSSVTSFKLTNSYVLGAGEIDITAQNAVQIECDAVVEGNSLGNVAYNGPQNASAVTLLTVDMLRNGKTLNGYTFHVGDNSALEADLHEKNTFVESEQDIGYSTFSSMPIAQNMTTKGLYYNTIQEAITAASAGDTIEIADETFAENLVIDKQLTIVGAGVGKTVFALSMDKTDATTSANTNKLILSADGIVLKNLTVTESFFHENVLTTTDTVFSVLADVAIENCEIIRTTGLAPAAQFLVSLDDKTANLTLKNSVFIAPVGNNYGGGIHAISPSIIGAPATGTGRIVAENCVFKTNGYGFFNYVTNLELKGCTFSGLENVEWIDDEFIREQGLTDNGNPITSLYMAINCANMDEVSLDDCTITNTRSWGILAAGNSLSVKNSSFQTGSRAISCAYGTITKVEITNNEFDLVECGYGIKFDAGSLTAGSVVKIEDNTFYNLKDGEDEYAVSNLTDVMITVSGSEFIDCDASANRFVGDNIVVA